MPQLSRRSLLALGSASAAGLALPAFTPRAQAQSVTGLVNEAQALLTSVNNGFTFQNFMMDAYAQGSTVRLTQSYDDANVGPTAFTYDNAVAIHAYLAAGDRDDIARAEVLGQGLLYAQANNFPIADGRFAQAYFVNVASASGAYITPAAAPYFFYGSAVGELDCPQYLRHPGPGRLPVRCGDQPVEPVRALHQRQVDRAQHRHICPLHHVEPAYGRRGGRERPKLVRARAPCAPVRAGAV